MLKVAMLSKWHVHAKNYAKNFMDLDGVEVTAVWDNDVERGKEWAEELGCDFVADLDEVLARDDVDAVAVNTSTNLHKEVIIAAAKAKKHIFTEKVLAITTEDAVEIAEEVKKAGVIFNISYPKRCEGRFIYAKKVIDEGTLGDITHLYIRNAHDGSSSGRLPASFFDVEQCGGGAMMDLGAHPMYMALHFMGEPKTVSSVFTDFMGKGIDDNCVSVLEYENGALMVSETSFVSKRSPLTVEVHGTEGTLYISDLLGGGATLLVGTERFDIAAEDMPKDEVLPLVKFVNACKGVETELYTVDEGVQLTKLMVAAYKSIETGTKAEY